MAELFGERCKLYIDMGYVSHSIMGVVLDGRCDAVVEQSEFMNTVTGAPLDGMVKPYYIYDILYFSDAELLTNVTKNPRVAGRIGIAPHTVHNWFITDAPLEKRLDMGDSIKLLSIGRTTYYGDWREKDDQS